MMFRRLTGILSNKEKDRLKKRRAIIYRPAKGVGIGHFLYSLAGYGSLARETGAEFYFTANNTVFTKFLDEGEFISQYFDQSSIRSDRVHFGFEKVSSRLREAEKFSENVVVLGRKDRMKRAASDFPSLKNSDILEASDFSNLEIQEIMNIDVLYVDSIVAPRAPIEEITDITPLLSLSKSYLQTVYEAIGTDRYIGVHVRHGNGEDLDNRVSGGTSEFDSYMRRVANQVNRIAQENEISEKLVASDSKLAVEQLAELTGGRPIGVLNLPDRRFQDYLRSSRDVAESGVEKLMFDFAVLAGAQHIVSGSSFFPRAAALLSKNQKHLEVTND